MENASSFEIMFSCSSSIHLVLFFFLQVVQKAEMRYSSPLAIAHTVHKNRKLKQSIKQAKDGLKAGLSDCKIGKIRSDKGPCYTFEDLQ